MYQLPRARSQAAHERRHISSSEASLHLLVAARRAKRIRAERRRQANVLKRALGGDDTLTQQ
jgi:hypothetical protein